MLGVVFFFVLAVNRGWISAELRLGFGAAASLAVFAGGFWLKRRFGTTYATAGQSIAAAATMVAITVSSATEVEPRVLRAMCGA